MRWTDRPKGIPTSSLPSSAPPIFFGIWRRYTAKRNETAPRNLTQHDRTEKRGEKLFTLQQHHDTCPLPQLTKAKTKVYIITNSSYPHQEVPHTFSRQFAPCPIFPPFSRKLMLTKCRNNHDYLSGVKRLDNLSASFPIAALLHRKCFPQTCARSRTRSRTHMPDSLAHIQKPQHVPGS